MIWSLLVNTHQVVSPILLLHSDGCINLLHSIYTLNIYLKQQQNALRKFTKKILSREVNYKKFCVTMKSKFNLLRQICWNHLMKIIKIIFKKSIYIYGKNLKKKIIKQKKNKPYERVSVTKSKYCENYEFQLLRNKKKIL